VLVLALAFGGDDGSDLAKVQHDRPIPEVTEPDEGSVLPSLGPPETPVPDALAQAMADLLISDRSRERRQAARLVLAYQPADDVPEFLRVLAEMEDVSQCARKKDWLLRLGQIGDTRAIPALERMDAEPRNTCRAMFSRFDCYGCMREELTATLEQLRSAL
jgi:hypothetical protein